MCKYKWKCKLDNENAKCWFSFFKFAGKVILLIMAGFAIYFALIGFGIIMMYMISTPNEFICASNLNNSICDTQIYKTHNWYSGICYYKVGKFPNMIGFGCVAMGLILLMPIN